MAFLETMARVMGADTSSFEVSTVLTGAYLKCAQRAIQIRSHAEAAPNAASAEMLRELAAAEEEQARRLADALNNLGIETPTPEAPPAAAGTMNHWGRVVQDLQAHRQAFRGYREIGVELLERAPGIAGLFDELSQEEYEHCRCLRDLIARADPQALD